ncbi:MAG TPA: YihY/virulence factor BrkB family protein [Gemmataceae bacterium]|nr:YihY/virulence factor BrkB family protein [Gemmataceae bacterium]
MGVKKWWQLVKDSASEWMNDKAPRLGAALAYYTVFSIAPLLVLVIAVAGFVFGQDAVQGQLAAQIQDLVGEQGAQAIQTMVAGASKPGSGIIATALSIILLIVGAIGLFGELQDALNTIWEVQPKPRSALWGFLRERLLSFSMVLGSIFLLLVSLVISTILTALASLWGDWQVSIIGHVLSVIGSLIVITLLFAMIYRYLPDAKIAWSDVWLGAAVTAVLFTIGKFLIGLYLGRSSVSSAYGAAGSLAVLLIWLYYAAQIFLFGAEFTKVYADKYGSRIVPAENAEPVTDQARAQQGLPRTAGHPAGSPA